MAQESSTTTTTTTQAVPVPVAPPAPVVTVQSTTVTTVAATPLYIRMAEAGGLRDGEKVFAYPSGKVYNGESECVGHLTSLSGSDIASLPVRDQFKIRSPEGVLIASTRPSSAYDSDRKVLLSRRNEAEPMTSVSSTTTTTQQTTVTPSP